MRVLHNGLSGVFLVSSQKGLLNMLYPEFYLVKTFLVPPKPDKHGNLLQSIVISILKLYFEKLHFKKVTRSKCFTSTVRVGLLFTTSDLESHVHCV